MIVLLVIIGLLAVILAAFVMGAGAIATWYANRALRTLPDYSGSVKKISLSVWRGKGRIDHAVFFERVAPHPPLAEVSRIEFDIAYRELWSGRLSVAIDVDSARVHLVADAPAAKPAKEKADGALSPEEMIRKTRRWQDVLRAAFPVEITALRVTTSSVEYLDPNRPMPRPIRLEAIEFEATGLINRSSENFDELPAHVEFYAEITGYGKLHVAVQADPMAAQPRFHCALKLDDLQLPVWNPLLLDLTKLDVSAGTFTCEAEIEAGFGLYHGYIKPFFKDLNFQTAADRRKGFFRQALKTMMNWAVSLLESGRDGKVATKIPFGGNFEHNDVDVWSAVANLLRNAFVQGLREGLEGSMRRL